MSNCSIFASDLDGTLLNSQSDYDRSLFKKIIDYLNSHQMKFAAATGNQYQHVRQIFSEVADKIDYVAENGAVVVVNNQIIYENFLNKMALFILVEDLLSDPYLAGAQIILSARDHAYINHVSSDSIERAGNYYHNLLVTDNLSRIASEVDIYKVALNWPDEDDISRHLEYIENNFEAIRGTSSGRSGIDIISKDISKASGLKILLESYGDTTDNLMVFGDNGNDLEMLEYAGVGVAVQNAIPIVKQTANKVLNETNDQSAVLKEIINNLIKSGASPSFFES
ncbi:HAD family hydrolase [Xylocopilactobacillus apis]|uniref:Haloacid dehalogenase n=1 Tax=Xylocopilactobacillus apis TaxID=2932183 RepID=A0AAU9CRA6_9LACO|nr:HAD family hydrolase [Xylocopilactobacillus apis]BDR56459.1 haloacid dehalogenase [Xylocopilactobacillus apis]